MDAEANAKAGPCLSAAASKVKAYVILAHEELMIARHTQRILQNRGKHS